MSEAEAETDVSPMIQLMLSLLVTALFYVAATRGSLVVSRGLAALGLRR
jgi:hypothetical protein